MEQFIRPVAECGHFDGGYMKSREILSTVFTKAKDLAKEMTELKTQMKRLIGQKKGGAEDF